MFYLISPPEKTDWRLDRDELIRLLKRDWPGIEISGPDGSLTARDVVWRYETDGDELEGAQNAAGQAHYLHGPLELIARHASWWRQIVPASVDLRLYDESYSTVIELQSGVSEDAVFRRLADPMFATEMSIDSQDRDATADVRREPTVDQVEGFIRLLDQRLHTEVSISGPDSWSLLVGGGAGAYLVFITNQMSGRLIQLRDPRASASDEVPVVTGGQLGLFPAEQVVNLDHAVRAARYFAAYGEPEPSLAWTDEINA